MGILPLQMPQGWRPQELGLVPGDIIEIEWDLAALSPRCPILITVRRKATGGTETGAATALLDTAREVALIRAGGIIPTILKQALSVPRTGHEVLAASC